MFEITPYTHRSLDLFDPFRELSNFERGLFGKNSVAFSTDIRDNGDSYLLEADLPGFDKENIHIDIKNGLMTITAERHSNSEKKDSNDNVICSERSYGLFTRSFNLTGSDEDAISAEYKDGVLSINMPKKEKVSVEGRRLEIK